jgi:hypothetical protein
VGCTAAAEDRSSTTSPTPSPSPTVSPPGSLPGSDVQFLLRERYPAGHRIPVRIQNVGDIAYEYQTIYQACFLAYRDEDGREFLIPPGTHCDLISTRPIQPGETTLLFKWSLDECTKDRWGCARSRPLQPGTYHISGTFKTVEEGGTPARAEATLKVTTD